MLEVLTSAQTSVHRTKSDCDNEYIVETRMTLVFASGLLHFDRFYASHSCELLVLGVRGLA